jgi:hypothetical protein
VQRHLETDLEGALQWLLRRFDKNIVDFLDIHEKVLKKDGFPTFGPRVDSEVVDYIDALGFYVRGNNEWSFITIRHLGEEGLAIQKHRKGGSRIKVASGIRTGPSAVALMSIFPSESV